MGCAPTPTETSGRQIRRRIFANARRGPPARNGNGVLQESSCRSEQILPSVKPDENRADSARLYHRSGFCASSTSGQSDQARKPATWLSRPARPLLSALIKRLTEFRSGEKEPRKNSIFRTSTDCDYQQRTLDFKKNEELLEIRANNRLFLVLCQ